jgi:3-phosphoshikimate 1-carboxyvinyltransferase
MTKKIIERIGGNVDVKPDEVIVKQLVSNKIPDQIVESDWSSASYFFSLVALSDTSDITLSSFFNKSIQGDSRIVEIYKQFGVETNFINNKIYLKKNNIDLPDTISLNLRDNPDLAQTIIVTCLGLGVDCKLEGLHTLKLKETDRLLALKREIEKFEVDTIAVSDQSITLINNSKLKSGVIINTYDDHRMAMSFAPLSMINPISINNPEVVSKSYLNFWNDLESIGFKIFQK